MSPVPIAEVNGLDEAEFIARFAGIYERSPWVAAQVARQRPFAGRTALERAMQQAVLDAGRERQLELLRLHPRLGARLELSAASRAEQAGAGLDGLTAAERSELAALNEAYEQAYGFPYILAVRGASLRAILEDCRQRTGNDAAAEFDASLRQVFRIAGFRIADLVRADTLAE